MLDIKRSIATGWGKGKLYPILKELQQFSMGMAGIQGEVYFVEGNAGDDGNDGKSWDKAFKTLAVAMAASHANIAASNKGWAARNTIFCKGDYLDEDLTKLAQKTDIIGVGSCDDQPRCRLIGTHVIPSTTAYMGCRFFNMEFRDDGATANFTITTQSGIEFHNCVFECAGSGTIGIFITTCPRLVIDNCFFQADSQGTKYSIAAIQVAGSPQVGLKISNSSIVGAIGIDIDSTDMQNGYIFNNQIISTTLCIDDESDDAVIMGNRMVTDAAKGTLENVIDYNAALAVDNILTGSDGTIHCPAETA